MARIAVDPRCSWCTQPNSLSVDDNRYIFMVFTHSDASLPQELYTELFTQSTSSKEYLKPSIHTSYILNTELFRQSTRSKDYLKPTTHTSYILNTELFRQSTSSKACLKASIHTSYILKTELFRQSISSKDYLKPTTHTSYILKTSLFRQSTSSSYIDMNTCKYCNKHRLQALKGMPAIIVC